MTLGIQIDRPATEYGYLLPHLERGEQFDGVRAFPLRVFEEKPSISRARQLRGEPGVAWNAGMFLWRRRAIREALERYTGLVTLLGSSVASESLLASAYDRLRPVSIDHAVMEGAARDGRVAMAAMNVGWSDIGNWTALLAELGARGTGRVVPPGDRADAGEDDLILERVGGRLGLSAGPRSILASAPVALLVGAASDRPILEALLGRVEAAEGGS